MTTASQQRDPRTAGDVARYHAWRTIQTQSVAAHSWNVLRILLAIWPDAPRHLIIHTMVHDVGEVVTGDLPFPVKKDNPALRDVIYPVEQGAHQDMVKPWLLPAPQELSVKEKSIFKIAEYIEMWEFALVEIEMGSRHGVHVANVCYHAVTSNDLQKHLTVDMEMRFTAYMRRRVAEHSGIVG